MTPAVADARLDIPVAAATLAVPMGQWALADATTLLRTVGLGSCIAVVVFAPAQQLAGLAHCMLPQRLDDDAESDRFVDRAVPRLLAALRRAGAEAPFTATLVGGASMFPGLPEGAARDIGADNIAAARAMLTNSAVPVRSEDVGGHVGRSILVDPATQRVIVHTIRDGDRCL